MIRKPYLAKSTQTVLKKAYLSSLHGFVTHEVVTICQILPLEMKLRNDNVLALVFSKRSKTHVQKLQYMP